MRLPVCNRLDTQNRIEKNREEKNSMELIDGTPAHGINEYQRICKCIEIVKSGAKQCEVD